MGETTFPTVSSFECVFCFFNRGLWTSGSPMASGTRVLFLLETLDAETPGTLSPVNEALARLRGLPSPSLKSLPGEDIAEGGSKSISFLGKDAEVETDPLVDSGAFEDVGDRNEPFALVAVI